MVVAIGTEGTAPVLARQLKADIESLLPQHLGRLASAARGFRDRVSEQLSPGRLKTKLLESLFQQIFDRKCRI